MNLDKAEIMEQKAEKRNQQTLASSTKIISILGLSVHIQQFYKITESERNLYTRMSTVTRIYILVLCTKETFKHMSASKMMTYNKLKSTEI